MDLLEKPHLSPIHVHPETQAFKQFCFSSYVCLDRLRGWERRKGVARGNVGHLQGWCPSHSMAALPTSVAAPEAQGYSYYFAVATGPKQTLLGNWPCPTHKSVPESISLQPVSVTI